MTPHNLEIKDATVLVVDDIAANRNLLRETLEPNGYEILLAPDGETGIKVAFRACPDLILLDVMMPKLDGFETCRRLKKHPQTQSIPVIFITAKDETHAMVEGFQSGGIDYVIKPFQAEEVLIRVRTHLQNARLTQLVIEKNTELEAGNKRLREEIQRRNQAEESLETADQHLSVISQLEAERWGIDGLIARSPAMEKVHRQVRKLQSINTGVLITGESGTGKELIARALHFGSPRAKKPFLPVNCPAIPGDLAEALFFGHVKGAFSGAASDKCGYFENAREGTLFLDEIGDMPALLQAKLLRVLENGTFLPLGSAREKTVDVRVIAATNADLKAATQAGTFRSDLYFRLARFVVELPPLRDRRDEIAPLAEHFCRILANEMKISHPKFTKAALALLTEYEYPGNVRELKNLIERALIESGGMEIGPEHLEFVFPPVGFVIETPAITSGSIDPQSFEPGAQSDRTSDEATIIAYVREHGSINNSECRELLSVGIHRAWYLLRKLNRSGILRQDSSRRWANYRLP